jgi:hypothetical protein
MPPDAHKCKRLMNHVVRSSAGSFLCQRCLESFNVRGVGNCLFRHGRTENRRPRVDQQRRAPSAPPSKRSKRGRVENVLGRSLV